jgi:hypothetical protein
MYYYYYIPLIVNTSWSFPHSWLITGFVTRVTRHVPHVEKSYLSFQSSLPMCSGVRVARSLVFYVIFCRSLFVILSFFLSLHCLPFFDNVFFSFCFFIHFCTLLQLHTLKWYMHIHIIKQFNTNSSAYSSKRLNKRVM